MTLFGSLAQEETDTTDPHFDSFFYEPLEAVGMTEGRDGNMNVVCSWYFAMLTHDFKCASRLVFRKNSSIEQIALAICNVNDVSDAMSQHPGRMPGFIGIEVVCAFVQQWLIEQIQYELKDPDLAAAA